MSADVLLTLSFLSSLGLHPVGWCHPPSEWVFSCSTFSFPGNTQRCVSMVIVNQVKLTQDQSSQGSEEPGFPQFEAGSLCRLCKGLRLGPYTVNNPTSKQYNESKPQPNPDGMRGQVRDGSQSAGPLLACQCLWINIGNCFSCILKES